MSFYFEEGGADQEREQPPLQNRVAWDFQKWLGHGADLLQPGRSAFPLRPVIENSGGEKYQAFQVRDRGVGQCGRKEPSPDLPKLHIRTPPWAGPRRVDFSKPRGRRVGQRYEFHVDRLGYEDREPRVGRFLEFE